LRAVLDTNVLISALITGRKPRRLIRILSRGEHSIFVSEFILKEFSKVSADVKIKKYASHDETSEFLGALLSNAALVRPRTKVDVFGNEDDEILALAKDCDADILVTGDRHLLELRRFEGTRIVSVEEAISALRPKSPRGADE